MPAALMRALPLTGLLALAACWTAPTHGSLGSERDDVSCDDGRDNDGDGLIDCADPDCLAHSVSCGQLVPLTPGPSQIENTYELCHDRIDNDDSGTFDCGDKNCTANPNTCCTLEFSDTTCSDHLDNDQNGFADCKDSACSHGRFVTVCKRETNCADGYDNDGDDLIDCADPDCATVAGPGGTPCACHGGPPMPETTVAACSDHVDNDCNGYTDCGDHSCSLSTDPMVAAVCAANAENTLARCMDHIDNDGNGYTDCGDHSCSLSTDPTIMAYCGGAGMPPSESVDPMTGVVHPEYCNDGVDNDHNGFTDCADFGCARSTVGAVLAICFEDMDPGTGVTAVARCMDGLDNDGDGAIDCDDYDCAENPAVAGTVCDATDFCAGGIRHLTARPDGGV